jgi:hypothetical protein
MFFMSQHKLNLLYAMPTEPPRMEKLYDLGDPLYANSDFSY